jgi:UDP-N-acetylglucosamine acyltransferase
MSTISEHAIIDSSAVIGSGVEIGPWTEIGPNVVIGDGTKIASHVVVRKDTTIGKDNKIFQFASIGEDCQDLKYKGETARLEIGDRNTFREYVSIHRGTEADNSLTKIGNDNLFITQSHVGHDCIIGNNCIIGHSAGIAGHVHIGDYVILSGFCAIHQFCHLGSHSFVGGAGMVVQDIVPYVTAVHSAENARVVNINSEGLKRRGFSEKSIVALRRAFKILFRKGLRLEESVEQLTQMVQEHPEVQAIIDFIKKSNRGLLR